MCIRDSTDINMILVNDGSNKDLSESLNVLQKNYPLTVISNQENMGKGYSIRKAISIAQADFIIFTDVDFPYTTDSFTKIFDELQYGQCHVALGIRDENYYDQIPSARKRISKMLKGLNQRLMQLVTSDTQCGLKGMTQNGKDYLLRTTQNRYLIDLEFIKLISNDPKVNVKLVSVELRIGVTFSKVPFGKILSESLAYTKVLFGR